MTSTATRSVGESAPAATTFSYAQAAKGRTSSSAAQSSQNPSGANTPKDASAAVGSLLNGTSSATMERHNSADFAKASLKQENGDGDNGIKSSTATAYKSLPSSPSYGATTTSTLPRDYENSSMAHLSSDSQWDKLTASESADKAVEAIERKKGKKSKKDKAAEKDAEKEKEDIKPEILVPAPPPAINFWQQRKEQAAAKAKPSAPLVESSQAVTAENTSSIGSNMPPKSADLKKKPTSVTSDEADKVSTPAQNGNVKEQLNPGKIQKKTTDSSSKAKDEPVTKRGPRGTRAGDKEEKAPINQAPPPVEDAISWPTPESALEEEKRKAQEKLVVDKLDKDDKEDTLSSKPRQKKEWTALPYVPSVTFNTPLPARGRGRGAGRGGREGGGRAGHAPSGSVSGEKATNTSSSSNTTAESRERGRDSAGSVRATSLPPNSKRAGGEGTFNTRDQRKTSAISAVDKSRNEVTGTGFKGDQSSSGHNRRISAATHTEGNSSPNAEGRTQSLDDGRMNKFDEPSGEIADPRSMAPERRSDGNIRVGDYSKDSHSNSQSRERGTERGRGGYRGRGGNNNFQNGQQHAQQPYVNGHASHPPNGYAMRQNSGPYSPPLQQPPYPPQFPSQNARGGARNGPGRAQSIPNGNQMYPRFPVTGPPQMAPLQTAGPMYEYSGMQSISAMPYTPYVEQYSVLAMVTMQLQYYFSIDNLCKDVYLRKHMDGQGFVFLRFIANFKRIQQLTQDLDLLRFACQESEDIDIVIGDDGLDRVRRLDGWEKWVLNVEERDESVRNSGPDRVYRQMPFARPQQMATRMMVPGQPMMSPPAFSANGAEQGFRPYQHGPAMNGPDGGYGQLGESALSGAVPDFTPAPEPSTSAYHDVETKFTDEEIEKLNLVYSQKTRDEVKATSPSQSASARTFSNGSLDDRSITEELQEADKRQGRTLTNGDSDSSELSSGNLRQSRSPFAMSPTKLVFGNAPPIMWVKGQKVQEHVPESNKEESYVAVRSRALRHRDNESAGETDEDMKILFEFWSHFLVRNFNPRMYEEFRNYAFEDATQRHAMYGVNSLITFYDEVLNSKKRTIPEIFAKHYIELVNGEDPSGSRPGFAKLRAAWRNGALDMKSRKKIDNFVDAKLREELEK